jgi:mRNA-degrading endonuclease RelE of RelBE toxin-antitoxin system
MNYSIVPTDNFNKEVKQLAKKHRSIKKDLEQLEKDLLKNPVMGKSLGNNVYKIRMAISSKGKGKSGGARVISYVYIQDEQIFLLSIYDKSEKETVTDAEIKTFLKNLPI